MKKLISLVFAILLTCFIFAEQTSFNFAEVEQENIVIQANSSQAVVDKKVAKSSDGIRAYTSVRFPNNANYMSIVFIEPLKIENISTIKSAQLKGKSLGYDASVTLHFMNGTGTEYKKVVFDNAVPKLSGEYTLVWDNGSYIDDPRERPVNIKPVWPFSANDLFLYEIEFHQNACIKGFPYNAQEIVSLDLIYDKDNLEGNEMRDSFEDTFGIEKSKNSKVNERREKLAAEKKAAEDRELALMATETFEDGK